MTPHADREKMLEAMRWQFGQKNSKNLEVAPDGEDGSFNLAVFAVTFLSERGFKADVAAGSMKWAKSPGNMEHNDAPAFAREWGRVYVSDRGCGKEIHCWCVLPEEREIVDLSTQYIPERYEREYNQPWLFKTPPKSLWAHASEITDGIWKGCIYHPIPSAAAYIRSQVKQAIKPGADSGLTW